MDNTIQSVKEKHKALYDKIPKLPFECGTFTECCKEHVVCSDHERTLQPEVERSTNNYCNYNCGEDGCAIYEDRPFMCRLFGHSNEMKCPYHEYTPSFSAKEFHDLIMEYHELVGPNPQGEINSPRLVIEGGQGIWL